MSKIKVNYAKVSEIDFGFLPDDMSEGEIEIETGLWLSYLSARSELESLKAQILLQVDIKDVTDPLYKIIESISE